ncbi:MAG: STAS domain-containing protein [Candidatus Omnitrophota bacterium]|nr:MAG: STAS domain-containing protein [Candidatus Omnitrophota bacterium]
MKITKTTQQGVVICHINGDIDINSSPDIRKTFAELTASYQKKIVINLAEVSYIDSSGLATLVEMLKKIKIYGGGLRLSNLADKVKALFEITKLEKIFQIYDTAEQAVAGF